MPEDFVPMNESKEDSRRVERLRFMAEAVDGYLPPDWVFVLIIGKPGDIDTVNLVSNAPGETANALIEVMASTAGKRERHPI
jgi:hypothetical protein